ncbi:hypothetical protein [Thalassobius sp. Cn5-15]|uniref:hypothetical protein n=1 Tax=Thalassobius sp. Cn5-15 TaxID=2917763 RepID=UPI001EF2DB27|nr:hypothetical protein [Thalassobius sp. Cn5-15]MCG7492404.1 hypothetical protein [Thalassobius sp. Cn5-15]
MLDWLKEKVLLWSVTAAATLTALQAVMPPVIDWVLDAMVVVLVFIAARIARMK